MYVASEGTICWRRASGCQIAEVVGHILTILVPLRESISKREVAWPASSLKNFFYTLL